MTMRRLALPLAALLALCAARQCAAADGTTPHGENARWRSTLRPWHGAYYHSGWGAPVALVVPPTAETITDYTWGVGAVEVRRIDHQFQRPFPGYVVGGQGFMSTPLHPSHTRQLGVYAVRGPW